MSRAGARTLGAVAVLLGLAGCGSEVAARDVAAAVADAVEPRLGARPDVACPDGVPAEVGERTRCTLTGGGLDGRYGVTVTVATVDDGRASFDVAVDTEPQG
jgi:Domain of unknown function (DUF4333)